MVTWKDSPMLQVLVRILTPVFWTVSGLVACTFLFFSIKISTFLLDICNKRLPAKKDASVPCPILMWISYLLSKYNPVFFCCC